MIEPVPGANLVLTIDAELQRLAEKAVAHAAAAAVVDRRAEDRQDPRDGVSKPSFDPNVMTGHLTKAEYTLLMQRSAQAVHRQGAARDLSAGLDLQVRHRARRARGRPGRRGRVDVLHRRVPARRARTFRCHGTHGKVDLLGAIQHSCDVYFWKLAERIGLDRIAEVAREYGLRRADQPRPQRRLRAAGSRRRPGTRQHGRYKVGYATNAAIGQGDVEVTVLQMAMAYAALANGGTLYVPQVVERVESQRRPADRHVRAEGRARR